MQKPKNKFIFVYLMTCTIFVAENFQLLNYS